MKKWQFCSRDVVALLLILVFSAALAQAQQLVVMSSGGFAPAYKLLAPDFEKAKGLHLVSVWGPSMGTTPGAIPVRLAKGEAADVVIMARSELDLLAKKGLIVEGSQVDLVRSRIGLAIKAGSPIPNISTVDEFRAALLRASSIAYSDSASGVYIASEMYKRLGVEPQLAAKSRQIPAEPVGFVVARGEAEIGFQQLSELKPISGITVVGAIPDAMQKITVFAAGIVRNSKHPNQAHDLISYLSSAQACRAIEESALEPVACSITHH